MGYNPNLIHVTLADVLGNTPEHDLLDPDYDFLPYQWLDYDDYDGDDWDLYVEEDFETDYSPFEVDLPLDDEEDDLIVLPKIESVNCLRYGYWWSKHEKNRQRRPERKRMKRNPRCGAPISKALKRWASSKIERTKP